MNQIAIVLLLLMGSACTPPAAPPAAGAGSPADRLHRLYIELEQKHTRSMDKFGFSLEYAAEPPNTIVITLRYNPLGEAGARGKDVAEKARTFVKSLAAESYQLPDLQVRSENIRLNP